MKTMSIVQFTSNLAVDERHFIESPFPYVILIGFIALFLYER